MTTQRDTARLTGFPAIVGGCLASVMLHVLVTMTTPGAETPRVAELSAAPLAHWQHLGLLLFVLAHAALARQLWLKQAVQSRHWLRAASASVVLGGVLIIEAAIDFASRPTSSLDPTGLETRLVVIACALGVSMSLIAAWRPRGWIVVIPVLWIAIAPVGLWLPTDALPFYERAAGTLYIVWMLMVSRELERRRPADS